MIPPMHRTALIAAAILLYVIAIGCALAPADSVGKSPDGTSDSHPPLRGNLEGLPFRSITIQLQRTDWMDKYEACIDKVAAVGADTVQFVVDPRMENGASAAIYLDMRMTPTPDQLGRLIKHAKDKGLRVTLMPIVLLDRPRGSEWRGKISPSLENGGWEQWFNNYRDLMTHFAWIAESNKVDLLVVGSELVSSESKVDEWRKTIRHVRSIYKGKLTYSSNWDHYTAVPFWDELDLVGMNSYWILGSDKDVTVDEIVQRWREIQADLFKFQAKVRKPIMFLEIGWFSQTNAAHEPWDYTKDLPIDNELQKKLYEGFFQAWHGESRLGGFSVWEWIPVPDVDDTEGEKLMAGGYTPEGKPAEKALREYLSKPRWEVK